MNYHFFQKVIFTLVLCLALESPVLAEFPQLSVTNDPVEVRFICLAPSPYRNRHDSLRAGFGIFLLLRQAIDENHLNISTSYYDGSTFYENTQKIQAVLNGPEVILLGGSTWAQGPAYYVRRFFELAGTTNLSGVSASAWATAGGAHTGGELVVSTTLRSLMGMGAKIFTLGQKYMVFTTDERLFPAAGAFSLLDLWYMDQFARNIAVEALVGNDRAKAKKLSQELGTSPYYFQQNFPPSPRKLSEYVDLQRRLNAAANPNSPEYKELRAMLANDTSKAGK
ncbi:MAG: hypothetical protein VSS75_013710 [Candidatus Parabeggiatoa sp.]|nr:hypothetical protein [Candidatus Parabeggiatoa sp.]